jgi:hypothetical protein
MTRTLLLALALATACRRPDETTTTPTDPVTTPPPPGRPDTTTLPTVGEPEWLSALRALPGVTIDGLSKGVDATQVFLSFEQPVDHDAPGGPTFRQRGFLRHRDEHAPTVLSTYGYALAIQESEPGLLLKGNELELEKRFDGASVPEDRADLDWTTLTAEQVAADAHHVVELLSPLYDGAWIGNGGSNGGIDALSHRMFYPDDLAGTIAYVAPLMTSIDDDRIDAHFTDHVDPTCQAALEKLQLALLTDLRDDYVARGEAYLQAMAAYYENYGYTGYEPTFDRVGGLERSLQLAMIEFPFVFWQYSGNAGCAGVPDPEVDPVAAVDFGVNNAWVPNGPSGSDAVLEAYGTYFVSVNAYLGYPSVDTTPIAAYVDADLVGPNPAIYLPPDAPVPTFDALGPKIQAWLDDDAENVVLVDGQLDPFSRVRGDTSAADATVTSFVDPDGTHLTRLQDLTDPEVDEILDAIADWTR